jgi:predicted anti-sigma-YlaC factor YlaD
VNRPTSSSGVAAMTCEQIADFLMDYVSGELPEPTRLVFDDHLRVCTDCRNYLDGYRKAIALGKTVMTEPAAVVAEIPEQLVRAILTARRMDRDEARS